MLLGMGCNTSLIGSTNNIDFVLLSTLVSTKKIMVVGSGLGVLQSTLNLHLIILVREWFVSTYSVLGCKYLQNNC